MIHVNMMPEYWVADTAKALGVETENVLHNEAEELRDKVLRLLLDLGHDYEPNNTPEWFQVDTYDENHDFVGAVHEIVQIWQWLQMEEPNNG